MSQANREMVKTLIEQKNIEVVLVDSSVHYDEYGMKKELFSRFGFVLEPMIQEINNLVGRRKIYLGKAELREEEGTPIWALEYCYD